MTPDQEPDPVPGQMDVFDCLQEVERAKRQQRAESKGHVRPQPKSPTRPLTAAEVVALRLKETK
jgi:hypothetical protein